MISLSATQRPQALWPPANIIKYRDWSPEHTVPFYFDCLTIKKKKEVGLTYSSSNRTLLFDLKEKCSLSRWDMDLLSHTFKSNFTLKKEWKCFDASCLPTHMSHLGIALEPIKLPFM